MTSSFDSESIEIPCPECNRKHSKTIRWIKSNNHFSCGCGASIELEKDKFVSEISKVERALASFSKNITIKL